MRRFIQEDIESLKEKGFAIKNVVSFSGNEQDASFVGMEDGLRELEQKPLLMRVRKAPVASIVEELERSGPKKGPSLASERMKVRMDEDARLLDDVRRIEKKQQAEANFLSILDDVYYRMGKKHNAMQRKKEKEDMNEAKKAEHENEMTTYFGTRERMLSQLKEAYYE